MNLPAFVWVLKSLEAARKDSASVRRNWCHHPTQIVIESKKNELIIIIANEISG